MCKDESEWLSAHCKAEICRGYGRQVGDSRHSVWTLCVDGSGGSHGYQSGERRACTVDGRRDRGNERIEMNRDRQAEFRAASAERPQ